MQDLVNANPAGTTFLLQPGVYRMQMITPKDGDIFIGESGAILNGSQLLLRFSHDIVNGISYWVAPGPSHPGQIHGNCESTHPLCGYPEDFFIDDQPLRRAASLAEVTTGAYYFDYPGAKIYFLDNPNGHIAEISTTRVAFAGSANNVTIQGVVIEKYANPAQIGAIGAQQAGSGWIIQNNEVRLNHGAGINAGNSAHLISNYIHDNGELGISAGSGALVEDNEIARNNWAGFSMNWEAGGAKFGNVQNVIVRGNYIHDNAGMGIWSDGFCSGGLYENNTVANNAMHGILHEISHSWTIRNNVVFGNSGAGIQLDESDHVEVAANFVANNYKGIALTMSPRPGAPGVDLNHDVIHDNTVVQSKGIAAALYQNVKNDVYYSSKNNRFANNNYCLGTSLPTQKYWWLGNDRSQAQWVGYGQDETGTWSCPGVFISSPNKGATVSGTVTASAFAADTGAVSQVMLYLDGALVTASTTKPYVYPSSSTQAGIGVTYSWDTTQVSNGIHTLRVKARNAHGDSSSSSINVTINNASSLRPR